VPAAQPDLGGNRWTRDFTLYALRSALIEMIACFPVYRRT